MDNLRCFVAIDFPAEIKKALAGVRDELKRWPARVKWVEPANYHLTLKFLGDVPAGDIPAVTAVLGRAVSGLPAFTLHLKGVGAFPNLRRPRVIWVGVTGDTGALTALQQAVDRELSQLGFPGEAGGYMPHLTLGRVKESLPGPDPVQEAGPALADIVENLTYIDPGPVTVAEVLLMESRLSRSGPAYSRLTGFSLGK
jgi:2'-5' RNA ligase